MAPLPPPTSTTATYYSHARSLRRRPNERAGGARKPQPPPQRSASFHGRGAAAAAGESPVEHRQMRRPKTQPDLLAGRRTGMTTSGGASPEAKRPGKGDDKSLEAERRMPAKVLVNGTVQRSLGQVQVMTSTEWAVGDLVAAVARQYVKEGRRPPLPTTEPSALGLHYSQFSLECKNEISSNWHQGTTGGCTRASTEVATTAQPRVDGEFWQPLHKPRPPPTGTLHRWRSGAKGALKPSQPRTGQPILSMPISGFRWQPCPRHTSQK